MLSDKEKKRIRTKIHQLTKDEIQKNKTITECLLDFLSENGIINDSNVRKFLGLEFIKIWGVKYNIVRQKLIKDYIKAHYQEMDDRQIGYHLKLNPGTISHIRVGLGIRCKSAISVRRKQIERYIKSKLRMLTTSYVIHYKLIGKDLGRIVKFKRTKINEMIFYQQENKPYLIVQIIPLFWYLDDYMIVKGVVYDREKLLNQEIEYFKSKILDINVEFSRIIDRLMIKRERKIKER